MRTFNPFKSIDLNMEKAPVSLRYGVVLALTVLVSWIDLVTPSYIFLTGFYFLPIFLSVWCGNKLLTYLVVTTSIVTSLYMSSIIIPIGVPIWQPTAAYASDVIIFATFGMLMTRIKSLCNRLEKESQTDVLTGLRSRRAFLDSGQFEISRAVRNSQTLTLAMLDLDNFKYINDTQGHQAGDTLLKGAAKCMVSTLREVDIIGRLGGDEFAILLPNTDSAEAEEVLERVQCNLGPLLQWHCPQVSISIGTVTVRPNSELSLSSLMDQADAAMYETKRTSRNAMRPKRSQKSA